MKNLFYLLIIVILTSCGQGQEKSGTTTDGASDYATIQTAKEAYEFGFPLVVMHVTKQVMTNVERPISEGRLLAPVNQLVNANTFPNDKFRDVVRPNNDTYYSMAWLDLEQDPMVLQLPNTGDRYYLFPMLDAWTNVFFSPGKRTTGTETQTYLISGPKWTGTVPASLKQVKAPTNIVWLVGRTQVNSEQDGATVVKKIQDGYKLTPLSAYGKPYTPPTGTVDKTIPQKSPNDIVTGMSIADYFNLLNQLMINNPPAPADAEMMKKLAPLGIAPGATFDLAKFSQAEQDSMSTIPSWAKADLHKNALGNAKAVNGWSVNYGLGSYGMAYKQRGGVAFGGLGANLDADAMYPSSFTDADGQEYDGSKHNYVLHFDGGKQPPVNAFWSLTMYSPEGFLVTNSISRFAIGDRNPLKKNADGSVDIYIQKDDPGKDKQNNWLPAPNGPFNLLLRMYWPKEEVLNKHWSPPAVKKQA
ncbi:DUF1254 domain-containing protein [Polluticoccus soli]|uniref:DUF1254 domain-containing protein n=1 Tax=Polluticoccus soli TaxID=3034150 RepID=UPI0023E1EA38|nr:DUF1254 domain-containing protein [Flavipsychrobacter sp. JY13-12]